MAARGGLPVVLTRPGRQNEALACRLRAAGHPVLALPALQLLPCAGPLPDPAGFDLVMFVSGNAVRMFLDARAPASWPPGVAAAVVGPASAAALRAHPGFGAAPILVQPPADAATFDSEALWTCLAPRLAPGSRVLVVRGGSGEQGAGRDWLAGQLRGAGHTVHVCRAYLRRPAPWPDAAVATLRAWADGGPACWVLTSAEGVDALRCRIEAQGLFAWWRDCRFLATHPRIGRHLIMTMRALAPAERRTPLLQICAPTDDAIAGAIESAS